MISIASALGGISIPKLPLDSTENGLSDFFGNIEKLLPDEPQVIPELKFEDVVTWFSMQPRHPDVKYGAIAKRCFTSNNIVIVQVFLNHCKNVIYKHENRHYGRKLVVESLDDELIEAFGDKNVILVH